MRFKPLPPSPTDLQHTLMWRVLHVGTALSLPAIAVFATSFWLRGQTLLAAIETCAAALLITNYALALRNKNPLRGLQGMGTVAWVLLAFVTAMQGGLRAPSLAWIILLPALMMLVAARLATVMAVATLLFTVALHWADSAGWLPAFKEGSSLHRAITASLASVLFAVFAWYAMRWRERLAEGLHIARDQALAANRIKDRFIANLNHEIRTPMNALVAGVQLLSDQCRDSEQRALAQALQRSANHLLALVNDVLAHAQLEAGAVTLQAQAFSLRQLATNAVEMFSALATAKQLSLRLELPDATHDAWVGDPTRLLQVLSNLLSNAIKFTPAGGRVTLCVSAPTLPEGDTGTLHFAVKDTGPGIPPEVQARLFQPYTQGDESISRNHGGTGLGLSICKELLKLMQGEVSVTSQPRAGSVFLATVPLVCASPSLLVPPANATPAHMPLLKGMRVLLVEDDAVNRLVMLAVLSTLDAAPVGADSGAQALAQLERNSFDLVLMDCQMPEMDGLSATRRWRTREAELQRPRVPIVAVTGNAQAEDRLACLAAGMDDYLVKPVSSAQLKQLLSHRTRALIAAAPTPAAH
jgi:signal transduction histidine kinase/CheY-like chemotaxis protein